jgi:hypothetical protein
MASVLAVGGISLKEDPVVRLAMVAMQVMVLPIKIMYSGMGSFVLVRGAKTPVVIAGIIKVSTISMMCGAILGIVITTILAVLLRIITPMLGMPMVGMLLWFLGYPISNRSL